MTYLSSVNGINYLLPTQRLRNFGKPGLVLISPTPFCNLDCRYCYLPNRNDTHRMSIETFEKIIERLIDHPECGPRIGFLWLAGEPLIMPLEFYHRAFTLTGRLEARGIEVEHIIATNGTLLNPEWCVLFKNYNVVVGISMDGPADIHDLQRKDRNGSGTHARVLRGLELLGNHGIDYYVIGVVTRASIKQPDVFWDYFLGLGIARLALNIEEIEGNNKESSLDYPEAIDDMRHFWVRLLERWFENNQKLWVREFEALVPLIEHGQISERPDNTREPLVILTIDWKGHVSTFSPELAGYSNSNYGNWVLGNVCEDTISTLSNHPLIKRMNVEIEQGTDLCARTCDYFGFCGGGTPANKFFENGSFVSTETLYCRLKVKALVDAALEVVCTRKGITGVIWTER